MLALPARPSPHGGDRARPGARRPRGDDELSTDPDVTPDPAGDASAGRPAGDGPTQDGRTARRDRNRDLVLDAALELFAEHHLFPTAPEVAERSGVSPRSVFRYFEDTEALVEAAMARHLSRVAPLFEVDDVGVGPLEDRILRFTATRLTLYTAVAPTARAGLVRAGTRPIIAERLARARADGRAILEAMFAPELGAMPAARRRATVAAADTLFQFESVEHLRVRLGLSERHTAEALHRSLRALLAADVD